MRWIRAVVLAFSAYTRIPVPQVRWDDDALRLAIAFLPLAGAAVGLAVWCWQLFCRYFELGAVLFAAVATALPVAVTGGIHMDGFCDTSDALASYQSRERKLEIMKDPRAGAFALIRCCLYFLIDFALLHELFRGGYDGGLGALYALSRCLAAWSALTMPNARKDGMLASFTQNADRKKACLALLALSAAGLALWLWLTLARGILAIVLCLPVTLWYRGMAKRHFGGVTGDTTGFYLQTVELTLTAGLLAGGVALAWL